MSAEGDIGKAESERPEFLDWQKELLDQRLKGR